MKLISKFYKNIEENPNNVFSEDILYVNNISLIGFGASKCKDGSVFGNIYIDIAIRLDDYRSIIKLVYMYEVNKTEFDAFIESALNIPDRGITGYCPVLVAACDSFIKDKTEYYIYAVNGRDNNDHYIHTISFDTIGMIKIQYLINLVKQCIYNGRSITFTKTDYYESLHNENTKILNLAFVNQYNMVGFVIPRKKMFESKFNCLCLANFTHNRNVYNVYFYTVVNAKDRKTLKHSPYISDMELFNQVDKDNSYMLQDAIDVSYYSRGASELTNKVVMIGAKRDNSETQCFIFSAENYKIFCKTVSIFMKG